MRLVSVGARAIEPASCWEPPTASATHQPTSPCITAPSGVIGEMVHVRNAMLPVAAAERDLSRNTRFHKAAGDPRTATTPPA